MAKNSAKQKVSSAKLSGDKQRAKAKQRASKSMSEAPPPRERKRKRKVRLLPMKPNQNPVQLPENTRTRKGLSLKKLYRNTPALMKSNAEEVTIGSFKKAKTARNLPAVRAKCVHNDSVRVDRVKKVREVVIVGFEAGIPLSKQKRVLTSCSCLAGDTKVLTSKGWKTIFEIAEERDLESFPIKYKVDGKLYKGTAPFSNGVKPVYRVKFSNGTHVDSTADHRFLVKPTRGEPVWKELKDIIEGDNLVQTANVGTTLPDKLIDFYRMQFLGFLQGDGSVFANGRPDLKIYNADKLPMIENFGELGIIKDVSEHVSENTLSGGNRTYTQVTFNTRAYEIMCKHKYDNSGVPCFKNKEQFFGYLSGLLSADASVSSKDNKILSVLLRGDVQYIEPVFNALIRYGYSDSALRLERKAGTKVGKMTSTKDLYCLKISAKTFFELKDYLELTERFHSYEFKEFRDRIPSTKVISKSYLATKHVYDIYVPDINKFVIGGGVIAHNCENFVFTWEYANATWGASKIIYGNGDAPNYTNPKLAPGLCIAEGQVVSTNRGLVPIQNVRLDDEVLTLDGYKPITFSGSMGRKPTVSVKLDSGSSLLCTADHLIMTFSMEGIVWKKAGSLGSSDIVIRLQGNTSGVELPIPTTLLDLQKVSRSHNSILPLKFPSTVGVSMARILGYLISDGTRCNFTAFDERIMSDFSKHYQSCFGIYPCINKGSANIPKVIGDLVEALGVKFPSNRQVIPRVVRESSHDVISNFLCALYEGDGYITDSVSTYGTSSRKLAQQVHLLLHSFGISTSVGVQNSGVISTRMFLVRTSSVYETQKLITLLNPLTKGTRREVPDHCTSKADMIPINLRSYLRGYVSNHIRNAVTTLSDTLVSVKEALIEFDMYTEYLMTLVCKKLEGYGVLATIHNEGTKPLKAAPLNLIAKSISDRLEDRLFKKLKCKVCYSGKTTKKSEIYKALSKMDLKEHRGLEENLKLLARTDTVLTKVKSVSKKKPKRVYDITVPNQEHFVANGFVVHNCKHLSAVAMKIFEKGL